MLEKTTDGLRFIIICGMTRSQLMEFIKRKDIGHSVDSYEIFSDDSLRHIAVHLDRQSRADKQTKGKVEGFPEDNL